MPKYIPVKADFLRSAAENFQFVPQQPRTEIEYKRAYARAAMAAGLTREQVVRIYAFESGGDGNYDVQAGLEKPVSGAHAISTALGYNQLLNANTIALLAKDGDAFLGQLRQKAARSAGREKELFEQRIAALERMVRFCQSVPYDWSEHEKLAGTPEGIGVHAVVLDVDVGPLLQAQNLLDSVLFARRAALQRVLTAAELEMMNLTGDGNGLDMITLPQDARGKIPTANFFRQDGYERNPIAIRNNVVSALIDATNAVMDRESALSGAKDLDREYLAAQRAWR